MLNLGLRRGWRLEHRPDWGTRGFAFRALAVLLALALSAIAIRMSGQSPVAMAGRVLHATLGTAFGRAQLLVLATPLILLGAAFMLAARLRLVNLGLDGQLSMGAFAATAIGLHIAAPALPVLLSMVIASGLAGAVYALVPVWLRVKAGISEILTTLLLNWVALEWAEYIGRQAWTDTGQGGIGAIATLPVPYVLPSLWGDLHLGILAPLLVVGILWAVLANTVWGYEVSSAGANPNAAEYGGIHVVRHAILVMSLSGAIAGWAGMLELTGVSHRYSAFLAPNYGFLAVCLAILAGDSFPALIPWGLFLALVQNGGIVLRTQGFSVNAVGAITGLILVLASVGEVCANYRLVRKSEQAASAVDVPAEGSAPGLASEERPDGRSA